MTNKNLNCDNGKNDWRIFLWCFGALYLAGRPTIDFFAGADSPFSRHIARPIVSQITIGRPLTTEEGFNQFLYDQRIEVANKGRPNLARILTFPFSPDYESYKYENLHIH